MKSPSIHDSRRLILQFNNALITIQCEDVAVLERWKSSTLKVVSNGQHMGNVRGAGPASRSNEYNLMVDGMALTFTKGYSIKVTQLPHEVIDWATKSIGIRSKEYTPVQPSPIHQV